MAKLLAFMFPGPECWNAFAPMYALLKRLGDDIVLIDFGQHRPSALDVEIGSHPQRLALFDGAENEIPRMDAATYLRLHENIDFPSCASFYHLVAGFDGRYEWLFNEGPYYQRLRLIAHRTMELLRVLQPDVAICAHGANPLPATVATCCRLEGVPVSFFESAFFPGHILLDPVGMHFFPGSNRLDEAWAERLSNGDLKFSPDRVLDFIERWQRAKTSKYDQASVSDESSVLQLCEEAHRQGQRVFFLPEQIPWDANVLLGLDRFSSWENFVAHVLDVLPANARLVVKSHPKRRADIPSDLYGPNALIVSRANIHTLFSCVDAVCTFSSNVGFEALLAGKRVLCGGSPHYARKGFTTDLRGDSTDAALFASLAAPPRSRLEFLRYADHVIYEYLIREDDAEALSNRLQECRSRNGAPAMPANIFLQSYPERCKSYLEEVRSFSAAFASNCSPEEAAANVRLSVAHVPLRGTRTNPDPVGRVDSLRLYAIAARSCASATSILDVGCGTGYGAELLARQTGAEVVGIDDDLAAVVWAKENWKHSGLSFVHSSAGTFLANCDRQFDVTVLIDVCSYVPNPLRLLAETWRAVRPGGFLLTVFWNGAVTALQDPLHIAHADPGAIVKEVGPWTSPENLQLYGIRADGSISSEVTTPRFFLSIRKDASVRSE